MQPQNGVSLHTNQTWPIGPESTWRLCCTISWVWAKQSKVNRGQNVYNTSIDQSIWRAHTNVSTYELWDDGAPSKNGSSNDGRCYNFNHTKGDQVGLATKPRRCGEPSAPTNSPLAVDPPAVLKKDPGATKRAKVIFLNKTAKVLLASQMGSARQCKATYSVSPVSRLWVSLTVWLASHMYCSRSQGNKLHLEDTRY